jgi:hypothetical protein
MKTVEIGSKLKDYNFYRFNNFLPESNRYSSLLCLSHSKSLVKNTDIMESKHNYTYKIVLWFEAKHSETYSFSENRITTPIIEK